MTALAVHHLSKSFGGLRVTADVNLTVAPGERRLIIGPNGAGKTTLFNLIAGEIAPDSGSIVLFDRDITRVASHRPRARAWPHGVTAPATFSPTSAWTWSTASPATHATTVTRFPSSHCRGWRRAPRWRV